MKRAVWLLLGLWSAWLLLLPVSALAAQRSATDSVHVSEPRAAAVSVEALPNALPVLRVAPAPLLARLPVSPSPELVRRVSSWERYVESTPVDARRLLERVQVRRAVPRLNDAEPPWSAAGSSAQ
jgi:hypothetical protein